MLRGGTTLLLVALLVQASATEAATLDKETCTRLEEEQVKLEKSGVRLSMTKGPAWAKDNLPLDKLQEVRRLIEVDEQILFRCQGKPLVLLPSSVDADPAATSDDNAADGDKAADGKAAAAKAAPGKDAPAKDGKAPAPKKAAAVKPDTAASQAKAHTPVKKAPPAAAKAAVPTQTKQTKDAAAGKPKPAPKKKVDDAYKPPQGEPGQNPFGVQDQSKY